MDTKTFFCMYGPHDGYCAWATGQSDDMADVWQELVHLECSAHGLKRSLDWMIWTITRPGIIANSDMRRTAIRFIRNTPLFGGGTVWDLLNHEKSKNAIALIDNGIDGDASERQLAMALDDAYMVAQQEAGTKANLSRTMALRLGFAKGSASATAALAAAIVAHPISASVTFNEYILKESARMSRDAVLLALEKNRRSAFASESENAFIHRISTAEHNAIASQCRTIAELTNPFKKKTSDSNHGKHANHARN